MLRLGAAAIGFVQVIAIGMGYFDQRAAVIGIEVAQNLCSLAVTPLAIDE